MRVRLFSALTLLAVGVCQPAWAQAPEEDKLACIAAASRAQSDRDQGHLLEARRALLICARDVCPAIVRKTCSEWLSDLQPRIPSIVIQVLDDAGHDVVDAQATVDGAPTSLDGRPVPLDPGTHQLAILARDAPVTERVILAVEHQGAHLVTVRLPRNLRAIVSTTASDSPQQHDDGLRVPNGAWILAGVGLAAGASFTYFALAAQHDLDKLKHSCAPHCDLAATESGRNKAIAADVSLGVAAAALAGATLWTLLSSQSKSKLAANTSVIPMRSGVMCVLGAAF